MNLLKLLTRLIDYVNQFIKNVTNLGKKKEKKELESLADLYFINFPF